MTDQTVENLGERWTTAMADGDFEQAWRISDQVLALADPSGRDDPALPYHRRWVWDGRPVDGRSVLVRCYHGLGDTLQFCRYLPALRRRARHLVLEVQPALVTLLDRMPGPDRPDRIVAFDPANPLPPAECDVEIMELAQALRLRPDPSPYLGPCLGPCLGMRLERRAGEQLRVGLCWRANPNWNPARAMPPACLAPLLVHPRIEFVSLQRDAVMAGLPDDCPPGILDTARRIAGLDLVISVDTMIAHLAGALGVQLWLLLPAEPDWRWRAGGTGSVWYRQVRKHQQHRPGDWSEPLAAIAAGLTIAAEAGTLPVSSGF